MSDTDRALAGLDRRRTQTPIGGVIITDDDDFENSQPTPPPIDPQDLIAALWPLRHAGNLLTSMSTDIAVLKEKAAQLEKLSGGLADIGETRTEMREGFADIRGEKGDNGKLGELRRRVDLFGKAAWLVIGGIGAAMVKVVFIVRTFDAVEAKAEHNADAIAVLNARVLALESALLARHRFPPAEAPDRKDSP